ncbi:hypothetical protein IC582_024128 [Cucumis melo]
MGLRSNFAPFLSLLFLLASTTKGQSNGGVFDVTRYGAKPNTDITHALLNAWKGACASTSRSKVLIPKGVYLLSQSNLKGPCKSSIEIQVDGTLQAPPDPKGDGLVILEYIDKLTLSGTGVFDGQGKVGWEKNDCHKKKICTKLPMTLKFNFVTNSIVRDITSLDSKNFHINILGCKNLTFQHVTISAPEDSPNTDGIHISSSEQITILNTKISTGDDCVSVGDSNKQIMIRDVTCGPGHGISIGSLGKYSKEKAVEGVWVTKCKLTSTTNGIPSSIKISKVSFKNIRGTSATPVAVKLVCSKKVPCEAVEVVDIDLKYNGNKGPIKSQCANVKPIISGKQNPRICA